MIEHLCNTGNCSNEECKRAYKARSMPTQQSGEEKLPLTARQIVTIIASKEDECRKMGFASNFLEAIENSIEQLVQQATASGRSAGIKEAMEVVQGAIENNNTSGYQNPSAEIDLETVLSRLESLIQKEV